MNLALTSIIALIQQVLPLISGGSAATGLVGSIISVLQTWLPLIATEITTLYTPVKNIIVALQTSGPLTDQQKGDLSALDAKVDQAFDAASAGLDPDAPAA